MSGLKAKALVAHCSLGILCDTQSDACNLIGRFLSFNRRTHDFVSIDASSRSCSSRPIVDSHFSSITQGRRPPIYCGSINWCPRVSGCELGRFSPPPNVCSERSSCRSSLVWKFPRDRFAAAPEAADFRSSPDGEVRDPGRFASHSIITRYSDGFELEKVCGQISNRHRLR